MCEPQPPRGDNAQGELSAAGPSLPRGQQVALATVVVKAAITAGLTFSEVAKITGLRVEQVTRLGNGAFIPNRGAGKISARELERVTLWGQERGFLPPAPVRACSGA